MIFVSPLRSDTLFYGEEFIGFYERDFAFQPSLNIPPKISRISKSTVHDAAPATRQMPQIIRNRAPFIFSLLSQKESRNTLHETEQHISHI